MFADVSFPISSYKVFTYRIPQEIEPVVLPGVRVRAPLGRRRQVQGVVVHVHPRREFKGKILSISDVVDQTPILDRTLWELLNWVSRYYLTPLGQVMRTAVPSRLTRSYVPTDQLMVQVRTISPEEKFYLGKKAPQQFKAIQFLEKQNRSVPVAELNDRVRSPWAVCRALENKGYVSIHSVPRIPDVSSLSFVPIRKEIKFTTAQQRIIDELVDRLTEKEFVPYLLQGVTGSGKTEIYIDLAKRVAEQGRRSIMLLPEISLTPQFGGRFRAIFGDRVAIWHSRMTPAERAWTWKQICSGAFSVVVGARSAVFTPVGNLGLIVVDEEQESGFKQESPAPRYHARDVALMRGKLSNALTILAGATPSLESYYNRAMGKLNSVRLKVRYGAATYPRVHMVNMMTERDETKNYSTMLSRLLTEKIENRLEKREQIILLQNRRGYSPIVYCGDCGDVEMCRHCNISLTFHKAEHRLKCHYCNFHKSTPQTCEACGSTRLILGGTGTQKVEEGLKDQFPGIRLVRMDLDTTQRSGAYARILEKFGDRAYDVLLGTQMIAKGLDFENVTLVGVISADTGLYLPDFRAGERTFQLVYQVAGRSGRGRKAGEVVIQTNDPENAAIKLAARLDLETYYNICLSERNELMYAPFSWMAKVEFLGRRRGAVEDQAERFSQTLTGKPKHVQMLGPAPCPIERIRGNFRYQIIFKSPKEKDGNGSKLRRFLEQSVVNSRLTGKKKGVEIHVDVDPVSLL